MRIKTSGRECDRWAVTRTWNRVHDHAEDVDMPWSVRVGYNVCTTRKQEPDGDTTCRRPRYCNFALFRRVPKRTRSKLPDLLDKLGDRFPKLRSLACRDPFKMHPALESEALHRIEYVTHPLLGVCVAVGVVVAAVWWRADRCGCMPELTCHSAALCVTRPSELVRRVVGRGK